jgi:hypothetical protein
MMGGARLPRTAGGRKLIADQDSSNRYRRGFVPRAPHRPRADGLRRQTRRSVDIELRSALESRERKQGSGES